MWWNRDQQAASPDHLVLHLPAKLSPPLLEDGLVESGFLLDVPTWLFDSAGRRSGHIAHLEIPRNPVAGIQYRTKPACRGLVV